MNIFWGYYWYAVKNFCKSLSIIDSTIIVFIPCLVFLFVFGSLFQTLHLQKTIILAHLTTIKNISPLILALVVLFSRVIVHPEKTLNRILNSQGFYVTLPLARNTILSWCLLVALVKDSIWIMLGFLFTGVLAYELNLIWLSYFGQTVQLIILWVVTASLISFVSSISRIILANRIQFEKKIILKLLILAEILFSIFVFTVILYCQITLTKYAKTHWSVNDIIVSWTFFAAIIAFLCFVINTLFSEYEHSIKKYFETENNCYSVIELPKNMHKVIVKCESPLVRSILRLSLASRSYGFTKYHSLVLFSVQAIALLLFSISLSDSTISMVVFAVAAAITITTVFLAIFVSIPFIFIITKSLPLSFKEITKSYLQGGLFLAIPAFILVLLLSVCFGLSNGLKTIGLSLLLCTCIVPLRMFIALRYPYSRFLSDLAFVLSIFYLVLLFQVFFFLPIIGLILIVVYYRKKARELWNSAGLV